VLSGSLKYPVRQARRILHFLDEFAPTFPPDLALTVAVLPYSGERILDIKIVWSGLKEKGERLLSPLRTYLRPIEDSIAVKPYLDEQRANYGVPPRRLRERSKGRTLRSFERRDN
jgi:hypothetical protein